MLTRRRAGATAALLAALALTGCQKPVPEVTALADGEFVQIPASMFCFDGARYTGPGSCREAKSAQSVTVRPGSPVSVEVPQEIREHGWYVRVVGANGQITPGPIQKDSSYFKLSADFGQASVLNLQVVALPSGTVGDGQPSGIWELHLRNRDAS
jgi:hypothetical protein